MIEDREEAVLLRLEATYKLNINTASTEEIASLPGIGQAIAEGVVAYRRDHGGFKNKEEIMSIKGISRQRFNKLEDKITLMGSEMPEESVRGAAPQLDAMILGQKRCFTVLLNDGERFFCKLLELGQDHLHVETEEGVLLIPKHSIKYYVLEECEDKPLEPEEEGVTEEKTRAEEGVSTLPLEEIAIPTSFQNTPPRPEKVKEKVDYYQAHGRFDKPIEVEKMKEGWLLTDGYSRYFAAKELGLAEIGVKFGKDPAVLETVAGTVRKLVKGRGFGFIVPATGGQNIFFHRSVVEGVEFEDLEEGDLVECEVEEGSKGPQAHVVRWP